MLLIPFNQHDQDETRTADDWFHVSIAKPYLTSKEDISIGCVSDPVARPG